MALAVGAFVLALAAGANAAQPGKKGPAAAAKAQPPLSLPKGPIKITAERADLERREFALYRGNVRLVSAELELYGDRLELRQPAKGQYRALLTGKPARLKHNAVADAPPVAATAGQIAYDTRTALVEMSGGASLMRGTDVVSSDSISYNLSARRISATGAGGKQVEITIQPPEAGTDGQNTSPFPNIGSQRKDEGDGSSR